MDDNILEYPKGKRSEQDGKNVSSLFNIRVHSWDRKYFPLDRIKKILKENKSTIITGWVNGTIDDIFIQLEDCRIRWSDIYSIILKDRDNDGKYSVFIKQSASSKTLIPVFTPTANGKKQPMKVEKLEQITIDHIIPLKFILGEIAKWHPALKRILDNSDLIPSDFSKDETKDLENAMCAMRLNNDCVLMTQSQNSQKSNNINYIGAIKTGPCTFDYIMAKDLMCDGKEFYVHYTTGNESIPELVCGKAPECRYNYQDNNKTK